MPSVSPVRSMIAIEADGMRQWFAFGHVGRFLQNLYYRVLAMHFGLDCGCSIVTLIFCCDSSAPNVVLLSIDHPYQYGARLV